jgi:hypothetical protein
VRYLFLFAVFFVAALAFSRYTRARADGLRAPPPVTFRRWSPGQREAFVWTAIALTVLVFVPAAITCVALLLDLSTCRDGGTSSWFCTSGARAVLAVLALVVASPVVLKWCELLSRVRNYRSDREEM